MYEAFSRVVDMRAVHCPVGCRYCYFVIEIIRAMTARTARKGEGGEKDVEKLYRTEQRT